MGSGSSVTLEASHAESFSISELRTLLGSEVFARHAAAIRSHLRPDGRVSAAPLRQLMEHAEHGEQPQPPPPLIKRQLSWYGADDDGSGCAGIPGVRAGMNRDELLDRVAAFIASPQCKSIVFLTGAGMSVGAGRAGGE